MYNSEKVCEIAYGRIQGKRKLIKHFEKSKVWKNRDHNIKPLVMNTGRTNECEVKGILDRYYRMRFKQKAVGDKEVNRQFEGDVKEGAIGKPKKVFDGLLSKQVKEPRKSSRSRFVHVSSKRNSQKVAGQGIKLDESMNPKRPSSDDKEACLKDKTDTSTLIKKLKLGLKILPK
mmetsp:Transcript_27802/g.24596  ORF Transcript_27802/g.24596 Transcript_27802/m.24596 type:complete len:174 (+) Transcript_27802:213-734(+)